MAAPYRPVPYAFERHGAEEMGERARSWYAEMDRRRSVRQFSTDPVRHELIAEAEERDFYERRAPAAWREALAPLGTDAVKAHLTDAPYVVVLFRHRYGLDDAGRRRPYYYTSERCGIAAGMFITAVHHMGLATLPHTPSPMGFLADLLHRPSNEQAFLLLPVGYPAEGAVVPDIARRSLDEISVWL